jgi:site-specific recombinase XerD
MDIKEEFKTFLRFLEKQNKSALSIKSYRSTFNRYLETGHGTITNQYVEEFLSKYENQATYNKELAHFQSFSTWLMKTYARRSLELLDGFNLQQKQLKEDLPILVRSFEDESFANALKKQDERSYAFYTLIKMTGLRFAEVYGLTKDFYYEPQTGVHCIKFHGKGNKERIVPLNDEAYQAFLIWTNPTDKKPHQNTVRYYWTKAARISGHSPNPHHYRHTVAATLLDKGNTYEDISQLLGNSAQIVKQRYAGVNLNKLKEMTDKL